MVVSLMRQSQLRIEGDAMQDRANMRKIVLLVAAITFPIISIAAPDTWVQSERELRGECSNGVIGVSSLGGGAIGNALEMQRLACVAELNNRRAAQLRDAVSDLPLK
ncbi:MULTISPECIES: hypothetical protein [Burkholderia]|uniref:Lysozyme inhibitor LprI N-terminal domain-containing protein n=2 Tax=Burkholderiaceae TaxID=119060 RepID=A0ABU5WJ48_9BURK|nr:MULTISPECIES: hypothetical protein [Burkholderia]MEB2502855.1 hypothetical protein [Burkholderia anthinoferrum]MEB2579014.1 hypothetical protein [Burkholderia anthinoferrum]